MRRWNRIVSLVAVATVGLAVSAVGAGASAAARGSAADGTRAASPTSPAVSPVGRRTVTLVTGDKILMVDRPGGRTETTFVPAAGHSRQFLSLHLLGDHYLVPRDALPELGRRWVLADFDLTRLASGGAVPAARASGVRNVDGYRDVLSPTRTSGPDAAGGYHLEVLTLNGINSSGAPDQGDSAVLVNLQNTELYTAFLGFDGKPIKLQVPAGDYAVLGTFFDFDATENPPVQTVVVPQVSVTGNTTVTVDARTATAQVQLGLPVPSIDQGGTFTVLRTALKGSFSSGVGTSANERVYVNPTPPPSIGTLQWVPQWHEVAKTGTATYDVLFTRDGIPADEDFIAGTADLAAVDTTYASDGPTRHGSDAVFAFTPTDPFAFSEGYPLVRPLSRTESYSIGTGVAWSHLITTNDTFSASTVFFVDEPQSFQTGRSADAWLSAPLGPATPVDLGGLAPALATFFCPECRTSHSLYLGVEPWGDGTPGHVGEPLGLDHPAFSLYRGGVRVASGEYADGAFTVPETPADYRLTFTDRRTTPTWLTSTDTATTWTFASAAQPPDLPPHWVCPDFTRDCSIVSLLFPHYTLPVNLRSEEGPGPTGFVLGFDHNDEVAGVPVAHDLVSVSFDGGHTWKAATVRSFSDDDALVTYTNPSPAGKGVYASLRVSAEDGTGATVTQTVLNAYAVTAGAGAGNGVRP